MKVANMLFLIFFICINSNAASFIDGDFDQDGIIDKIEITHLEKEIHLEYTPSSLKEKFRYEIERLNNSEDGYSDLYKYSNNNYIVSYYSDSPTGKQFSENLYKWNAKVNNFVLYINADVTIGNNKVTISPKVAKCCFILGDIKNEPLFLSEKETYQYAQNMITDIDSNLKSESERGINITNEEIYLISKFYTPENKNTFTSLLDLAQKRQDQQTVDMLSSLINHGMKSKSVIVQGPFSLKWANDVSVQLIRTDTQEISLQKTVNSETSTIDHYVINDGTPEVKTVFFRKIDNNRNLIVLIYWNKQITGENNYKVYAYKYDMNGNFEVNEKINNDKELEGHDGYSSSREKFKYTDANSINKYLDHTQEH